jgi:hypothetical protein
VGTPCFLVVSEALEGPCGCAVALCVAGPLKRRRNQRTTDRTAKERKHKGNKIMALSTQGGLTINCRKLQNVPCMKCMHSTISTFKNSHGDTLCTHFCSTQRY